MAKLSREMVEAINDQIQAELASAYIYVNISNYYIEENLNGFGSWFKKQADEEVEHAEKFISYLHSNNEKVILQSIEAADEVFTDYKTPLLRQLEHEELVTSLIYKLMDRAVKEKDYRTQEFLRWFVDEQFEEEEHSQELIDRYDLCADDRSALLHLDKELAARED